MRQVELGRSGIMVPDMALGTMTFGSQTPEAEAHRQMDMALEAGVSFWDCAETYPTTPSARETIGLSETILGRWFASRRGRRGRVVLATKVGGPGNPLLGERSYGRGSVKAACERSLRRLKCDVIDLYQLHWPERTHYAWRRNWEFDPSGQDRAAVLSLMDDVLGQMAELVAEGKVRAAGLSNETAWGTVRWLDRAAGGGPRMASVQNEYSLLHRLFDADLAEVAAMEGVTLLAYSPLASGILSGKYQLGTVPQGSRASILPAIHGRLTPRAVEAVAAYHEVAREARMDPVHMALAWHRTRPFVSVPIFGATTADQLGRILKGLDATVSPEVAQRIDRVNRAHPLPF